MENKYVLLALVLSTLLIILFILFRLSCIRETFTTYSVQELHNFFTSEECDKLIELATKKGLKESTVYQGSTVGNIINKKSRISKQAWLYDDNDTFITNISSRISKLVNIPNTFDRMEAMQVVRYDPGGYFEEHYDVDKTSHLKNITNRRFTFLAYLNDDFEGGETVFPLLSYTVKPERGKAILFWNVNPEGKIYTESIHSGKVVTKGVKWICNKWGG